MTPMAWSGKLAMPWKVLAVALLGIGLAACAGNPNAGPHENTGTLVGGLTGAVIGSQVPGGPRTRVTATVAGAVIGGMIGNRIGAALDDADKQLAYAAQIEALEQGPPGTPVAWRNPDSGRYGSIVPGPPYDRQGLKCRQFTHTIYIDDTPQTARGAACRGPDGSWSPAV
jgi:surface antigen